MADREIELSTAWCIHHDVTERWWGVEVEFPPALDDVFGLTNNKQSVRNLIDLANFDYDALDMSPTEFQKQLDEDNDPRGPLLVISQRIDSNLKTIRKLLKTQTTGNRGGQKRYDENSPEKKATMLTEKRKENGYAGASDKEEEQPQEERKKHLEGYLTSSIGLTGDQAGELAASTIDAGLKYTFARSELETSAFFTVKPKGGVLVITLNIAHSAYKHLVEVLEDEYEDDDAELLKHRLIQASDGLKLLLAAWARYEDEQPDGTRREWAQEARNDWGKIAKDFLRND